MILTKIYSNRLMDLVIINLPVPQYKTGFDFPTKVTDTKNYSYEAEGRMGY